MLDKFQNGLTKLKRVSNLIQKPSDEKALAVTNKHQLIANKAKRSQNVLTPEEIAYGYQAEAKRFLILPTSQFRMTWDWIIVILVFFNAVQLPLELGLNPKFGPSFRAFTSSIDFIFGVDLAINFLTTYKDPHSHFYVNNYRQVANNYLKHWFTIDMLAVFPFELFLSWIGGSSLSGGGFFRLTKNIRLLRMSKIFQHIKSINTSSFSNVIRLSWMVLLYVMLTHWYACAFGGIGLYFQSKGQDNWIEANGLDPKSVSTIYVTSLYWAAMTVTTVGYGDFTPIHPLEQIAVSFLMICSSLLYAVIFGNISLYIANLNRQETNWQESTQTITAHMEDIGLPHKLKWKVLDYHDYLWDKNHGQSGNHFKDIPQRLQVEVAVLVHGRMLRANQVFGDATDSFINAVAMKLSFTVCLPNEYVYEEGELANSIYFIARGQAGAFRDQYGSMCVYKANSYFGECPFLVEKNIALSTHNKLKYQEIKNATAPHRRARHAVFRAYSVRGYAYCDLWKITWNDFADALYAHKEIQDIVVKIAKERMQRKTFYDDDMLVHKVTMKLMRSKEKDDNQNNDNDHNKDVKKQYNRMGSLLGGLQFGDGDASDSDGNDDDNDDGAEMAALMGGGNAMRGGGGSGVSKKLFKQIGNKMNTMDGIINDVDTRTMAIETNMQTMTKKLSDMESNLQQGYFRLFQNMRDASTILQMVKKNNGNYQLLGTNANEFERNSTMSNVSATTYNSFFNTKKKNNSDERRDSTSSTNSSSNGSYQVGINGITPPISKHPSLNVSDKIPENQETRVTELADIQTDQANTSAASTVAKNVRQTFATRFQNKTAVPIAKRFTTIIAKDSTKILKEKKQQNEMRKSQAPLLKQQQDEDTQQDTI